MLHDRAVPFLVLNRAVHWPVVPPTLDLSMVDILWRGMSIWWADVTARRRSMCATRLSHLTLYPLGSRRQWGLASRES